MRNIIIDSLSDTTENQCLYLKRIVDSMPEDCKLPSEYLRLSNLLIACKERLLFKWHQIGEDDYYWLTDEMIRKFMERLDSVIGVECIEIPPLVEHSIIDR